MFRLSSKQLLSILLSLLLVHPSLGIAGTTVTSPPKSILGSITSSGLVQVGKVRMPAAGTLFAGDQVQTTLGSALIHYREGTRVLLASQSSASFSSSVVQLQQGQMSFQAAGRGPVFAASTLRLEPVAADSSANVTLEDSKASIAVTKGTVRVVDPTGIELASLRAGEARLFAEAAALPPSPAPASPAPPAAAAAPQGMGGNAGTWVAIAFGIAGVSLSIAALVRANNAEDRADEANELATQAQAQAAQAQALATQLQAQNAALQTQVTQLQASIRTLQTQLASLSLTVSQVAVLTQQLSAALAEVTRIQAALVALQVQINAAIAAGNLGLLQQLAGQQSALFSQLQAATNLVSTIAQQIQQIVPPVSSPFRVS